MHMKKALLYFVWFIALQLVGGAIMSFAWPLLGGDVKSPAYLITTTSLVNIVVIGVFLWTRAAELSPQWMRSTRPWAALCWCCLAAFGAVIPSAFLQEQMPELPNIVEKEFDMILGNRWGYVAIGLLAPLAEEIVLRGAILRSLLRWTGSLPQDGTIPTSLTAGGPQRHGGHWTAIALSALLFALMHFNPAQMPHAFLIGLLLGWMYWRTGSILPGVAYHWANNTVAYVLYHFYPDPNLKIIDIFGSQRTVSAAILFSLFILLPALYQLALRLRRA